MALRLNEVLGSTGDMTMAWLFLHASHSLSRSASGQEQSRYSASAVHARDFAWRYAPCSEEHLDTGHAPTGPDRGSLLPFPSVRRRARPKRATAFCRRLRRRHHAFGQVEALAGPNSNEAVRPRCTGGRLRVLASLPPSRLGALPSRTRASSRVEGASPIHRKRSAGLCVCET